LEYSSRTPRVSRSCVHDVHTTIALCVACAVADYNRDFPLSIGVRVIFQPAEEVWVCGATDVIEWGALNGVHSIYAVDVEPKLRVGRICLRAGAITSATYIIELDIKRPDGHTSCTHLTAEVIYSMRKAVP